MQNLGELKLITALIAGKAIAEFDGEVLKRLRTLKLKDDTPKAVRAERWRIGLKNTDGEIYRIIGMDSMGDFNSSANRLKKIGLTDEIEEKMYPVQGCDAIFRQ